jgi:hypothetical protein
MLTTNSRRGRQVTAAAALAGAALLVTACSSSTSSPTAASGAASAPASAASAGSPSAPASSAPASSGATSAAATPSSSPSVTASQTAASTFLAAGQDINGTAYYQPACVSEFGCQLSGDSTAFLYKMKWSVWSVTEAVGTGTVKLDDCNPNCAGGTVYPVATVITLSQPVKVCSSSGTRWFWSRASFKYPNGLPKALQSDGGPQNPWTFSGVASAANQGCSG